MQKKIDFEAKINDLDSFQPSQKKTKTWWTLDDWIEIKLLK